MRILIRILAVFDAILSIYFLITGNTLYAIYFLGLFIAMGIVELHSKIDELK